MRFRITHTTEYAYAQPVGLCQNEARLQPRDFARQQCTSSRLVVSPAPADYRERRDFFGNRVAYFAIQQPHDKLTVTAISEVSISPEQELFGDDRQITWEEARDELSSDNGPETLDARQYVLDSPMVVASAELAEYARPSFVAERPAVEVVHDLMQRIHRDFAYDPEFTTVATPLSEVLEHRRGVCQDFAHLAIGCLRACGLAARYVSGYIETLPAPGQPRLVGADASHAWFAVYVPGAGWLEYDPTNNQVPRDQHIVVAWGRDYADVTPLKGIAFGGGAHGLAVSVDVLRLE